MHAEKEYGADNPFLTYQLFNVEKPAAGRGLHLRTYDIAIAANVLHATKNIRKTLRTAKAVLKKTVCCSLMNWAGIRRLHMLHSAY